MAPNEYPPNTPREPAHDDIWDGQAYDAWFDSTRGAVLFRIESSAILRELSPARGKTILEVGCGTGRLLRAITAAGAAVIGIDPGPGMLKVAAHSGSGPLIRSRGEMLPFPDGCFDATVAMTVLEFVDDVPATVSEMARVTRAGGRIVIGSLNPVSPWGVRLLRQIHQAPWNEARFPARHALVSKLTPFGRTRVTGVALGGHVISTLAGGQRGRRPWLEQFCGFQVVACTKG